MSDSIEYAYIFLKIGSADVFISASGDDMYPVEFSCELLTYCTDVGSFLTILRVQTFVLFLAGNALFHGLLFSD